MIIIPTKDDIKKNSVTRDYVIWWSKVQRFDLRYAMPREDRPIAPVRLSPLDHANATC